MSNYSNYYNAVGWGANDVYTHRHVDTAEEFLEFCEYCLASARVVRITFEGEVFADIKITSEWI